MAPLAAVLEERSFGCPLELSTAHSVVSTLESPSEDLAALSVGPESVSFDYWLPSSRLRSLFEASCSPPRARIDGRSTACWRGSLPSGSLLVLCLELDFVDSISADRQGSFVPQALASARRPFSALRRWFFFAPPPRIADLIISSGSAFQRLGPFSRHLVELD